MGNKNGREDGGAGGDGPAAPAAGGRAPVEKVLLVHRELRTIPEEVFERNRTAQSLDISHNKLGDAVLSRLSAFDELTTLIADSNRFQKFYIPNMPKLTFLSLNSNRIADLESIAVVLPTRCPELRTLSLMNNPCYPSYELQQRYPLAHAQYRAYLIGHFKNLKVLDCSDVTAEERELATQLLEDIAEGRVKLSSLLEDPAVAAAQQQSKKEAEKKKKELRTQRKKQKQDKHDKKEKKRQKDKAGRDDGAEAAPLDGGEVASSQRSKLEG
ncbi:U2 small nuclear ribonucleoprotein Aprime [Diplonema papillatum]|nr:U2 small nuclear ribonucleoprotein Aprime [Diplonema papillatum]